MYNMEITIGTHKIRVEICILIIIVGWILLGHLLCSCCRVSLHEGMEIIKNFAVKEGFVGSNNSALNTPFAKANSPSYINKPSTWSEPNLTYGKNNKPSAGAEAILNRPKQPIPVPEGQLDMFATTEYKPECCPNTYSSSSGCACMTVDQYDYLRDRGGNNVPYSEY
jgi:hypothetical protein